MADTEQVTEQAAEPAQPVTPETPAEPTGTELVEFKDPKEEARFKRIYANMKEHERTVAELAKANRQLLERLESFETKTAQQTQTDQISALKAAKRTAYESGDIDKVTEIDDKIIELRLESAAKPARKPEAPSAPAAQLDPTFESQIVKWAYETDDTTGDFLRPWAQPQHPKYNRALSIAKGVVEDPDFDGKSPDVILAEVDRLMGVQKAAPRAAAAEAPVLGANRNIRQASTARVALSPEQERAARAMGLSPEKYKAAQAKWSSAR